VICSRPESALLNQNGDRMAFKKGMKKTGGRPKGGQNKRTVEIRDMLEAMDCDPLEFMAKVVNGEIDQKIVVRTGKDGVPVMATAPASLDQRLAAARELAQYIAPKRKAIELGDGEGNNLFAAFAEAISKHGAGRNGK